MLYHQGVAALHRLQASIGSLLAVLVPRAQIVPAPPAEVSTDSKLVRLHSYWPLDNLATKSHTRTWNCTELTPLF